MVRPLLKGVVMFGEWIIDWRYILGALIIAGLFDLLILLMGIAGDDDY